MDEDQKKRSFSAGMAVTFGLSNAAIIIGILNFSNFQFDITDPDSASTECKGAEKIPYYLIVMGTLLIILMTLKFFFKKCCGKLAECGEDRQICNSLNHVCKFTSETFFDIAAIVLIGIWNAVGTNWTFPFWDTVVYEPESSPDYCPSYVYDYACAFIILIWIAMSFFILCGLMCRFCQCFFGLLCCRPCKEADENQAV